MTFGDEILMIRFGYTSRRGKMPDRLVTVRFVKMKEEGVFYYSFDDGSVGTAFVRDIVTVNGTPV